MPQYLFYFNNIKIPLYLSAYIGDLDPSVSSESSESSDNNDQNQHTSTNYTEWQYFELQPYKKVMLLGIIGTLGGLLYHKKYLYSGILVTSLLPLHKLATIVFPNNRPNYLSANH